MRRCSQNSRSAAYQCLKSLFQIKVEDSLSQSAVSKLLKLNKQTIVLWAPDDVKIEIPTEYRYARSAVVSVPVGLCRQAKKMLNGLLGHFQIYHCCSCGGTVYYGDRAAQQQCDECGLSRFDEKKRPRGATWYFPISRYLELMWEDPKHARLLHQRPAGPLEMPDRITEPWHTPYWRDQFEMVLGSKSKLHLALRMVFDGLRPFRTGHINNIWAVTVNVLNLPSPDRERNQWVLDLIDSRFIKDNHFEALLGKPLFIVRINEGIIDLINVECMRPCCFAYSCSFMMSDCTLLLCVQSQCTMNCAVSTCTATQFSTPTGTPPDCARCSSCR
jgi:hypothetical protein